MANSKNTLEKIIESLSGREREIVVTKCVEKGMDVPTRLLEETLDLMIYTEEHNASRGEAVRLVKKAGFVEQAFERYAKKDPEFTKWLASSIKPDESIKYYIANGLISQALGFAWEKRFYEKVREIALSFDKYYWAAIACNELGRKDEAKILFEKESERYEQQGDLFNAEKNAEYAGNFERVVSLYEKEGKLEDALYIAHKEGLTEKCSELINKIDNKLSKITNFDEAGTIEKTARYAKELDLEEKAKELHERVIDFYSKRENFYRAGCVAEEIGQVERAIKLYKKDSPRDSNATRNLAKLAEKNGFLDVAIEAYAHRGGEDYASRLAFENSFQERAVELLYAAICPVFHMPCRTPFYHNSPIEEYIERNEKYIKEYKGEKDIQDIISKVKKNIGKTFVDFHETAKLTCLDKSRYESAAFHAEMLGKTKEAKDYRDLSHILKS